MPSWESGSVFSAETEGGTTRGGDCDPDGASGFGDGGFFFSEALTNMYRAMASKRDRPCYGGASAWAGGPQCTADPEGVALLGSMTERWGSRADVARAGLVRVDASLGSELCTSPGLRPYFGSLDVCRWKKGFKEKP